MIELRKTAIIVAACSGLFAAQLAGYVQFVIDADPTRIGWIIALLTLVGTVDAFSKRSLVLAWITEQGACTLLGLLGTVLGFLVAIMGVSEGNDVSKLEGVATALVTTIVGLIAHMYLIVLHRIGQPLR